MEFDHLFIATQYGAPEAQLLEDFGFKEGPAREHPGQGTANRLFYFNNGAIELIYKTSTDELHSELTAPTHLASRLADNSPSPFGVCFRPTSDETNGPSSNRPLPFPHWQYQPEYLPKHVAVEIASAPASEPMWFYLGFTQAPKPELRPPSHQALHTINEIKILQPLNRPVSEATLAVLNASVSPVHLESHTAPHMHISFNHSTIATADRSHSFAPQLPLTVYW